MTETSKEDEVPLQRVLCVYYPILFKKKEVQALIDSGNEVNAMTSTYVSRLSLQIHRADVGT